LIHPLETYLCVKNGGTLTDEQAKDSIAGLVNDPDLLQDVCAMFGRELNGDARCYVVGKVYDADTGRYGCITVLSEDVANIIGNDFLQKTHEELNYVLMCSYIEYCRFCEEVNANYDTWDDYLQFALQKSFLSLFKNGVRARLIRPDPVGRATLPTLVFTVYLNYGQMYG